MSAPDAPQAPTALAPQHLRLFALIVDYLLAIVLLNLASKLLAGSAWDLHPPPTSSLLPGWLLGAAALLLLRDALGGRSPGKWLTGIAVARAADPAQVPSLVGLVLRNAALVLLPVEAVLVFTNRYGRRLGDYLGGTVVVAQRSPAPATRRLLGLAILFLATTLAIFLLELWNVHRSAAYPAALRRAQGDAQVEAALGTPVHLSAPALARSADGQTMRVRLDAKGPRGEAHVDVHLRLAHGPLRWEPVGLEVSDAPASKAPLVRDAPKPR